MALEIHRKGQGVWARLSAYGLGGLLVVLGAWSLYAAINVPGQFRLVDAELPIVGTVTGYKVIALVVGLAGLFGLHWVLNRPKNVDLLIETEQEMKKVSWPTLSEVWNATLVVTLVTLSFAVAMSVFDLVLRRLFRLVF
jgi:preprotein translocase SecE subunit